MPSDPAFDARDSLDDVRLRLVEASADLLRPLPSPSDLAQRIQEVAAELAEIRRTLLLVYHVTQREQGGLLAQLAEIDQRLAAGWVPEGRPIEEVLERLRPVAENPETATG